MRKKSSTNFRNQTELASYCPLLYGLTIIGNRWKPYILWKLKSRTLRFGELKREIPPITERMLILSLKELEEKGLINRKDYNSTPPRVEYSLSEMGERLQPVLDEIYLWGEMLLSNSVEVHSQPG